MIPELGLFALCLAWVLALLQVACPAAGTSFRQAHGDRLAAPLALAQCLMVAIAFGLLIHAFIHHDFSVAYVAQNSNTALPWYYRVSAVWGGHEGSLLLWVLILNLWSVAVAYAAGAVPPPMRARVLAVLGAISLGFLSFILFTSNPFERLAVAPAEGNDLNPLLQDIGLILHPPVLYTGYVGFAVAFAFAVAAMLEPRWEPRWVNWSKPWALLAWAFLTLGIALGSWWAYYELGWGGWWFWDPVENASFMPWLVGTALIHAQAVTEKRGSFRAWTLLLSVFAFSLSLLGTFLVRSGVLTSVHAFASDPARGLFVLLFLGVVTGGALALYAVRMPRLMQAQERGFAWLSRESLLLVNNLLLSCACAMVLLGTLYPLVADALGWGKVSVGPPYFGLLFFVLMVPLVALVPLGSFSRWQREEGGRLWRLLWPCAAASLLLAAGLWGLGIPARAILGGLGAAWVVLAMLVFVWRQLRDPGTRARLWGGRLGMAVAHAGIGVFVAGVLVTEATSSEKDVRLGAGQSVGIGAYTVRFDGTVQEQGPNYVAQRGVFSVFRGERLQARLQPAKRRYLSGGRIMTEAAIDAGLTRDLYISMGEPIDGGQAWAVRIYHKPLVRWIWLGALLMMLGALITLCDPRYRRARAPISSPITGMPP